MKLTENVLDNEEGMQNLSRLLGQIVHNIHVFYPDLLTLDSKSICVYFNHCCKS